MELPAGNTQWLGATLDKERGGTNFAFYTGADATAVELCVFDKAQGPANETRYSLTAKEEVKSDDGMEVLGYIWHGHAKDVGKGALYGFRVHGPYNPGISQYYNGNKLLVDPCARAVTGELHKWLPNHSPNNNEDNAAIMPKARVVDWQSLRPKHTGAIFPHAETSILEMHVKGATILHPDIPEKERGTFKALGNPAFYNWVKEMNFTSVELMPIESFGTDAPAAREGRKNYWGYMTMVPTAPYTGYAASAKPEQELARAIRKLRKNDIEVIMDVVPNHTLESGPDEPLINLRGMDGKLYLHNRDYTGTGNTRDFGHPMNRRLFLEELKYWKSLGVSGFRIDLATVIGRENGNDFNPDSPMMQAIRHDPELKDVKFYGEPWDLGPHASMGEQIGRLQHHPAAPDGKETNPIAEWDGKARDLLVETAFDHEVSHRRNDIINALAGNDRKYPNPQHRVIKTTGSHDGPTPMDRVSYKSKQNQPNGEDNRDGNDLTPSQYWGNMGDRLRVQRFAIALLTLAQGTDMMTLGHERGKSQHGNTNPYCQDNETSYIPWGDRVSPEGRHLMAFTKVARQVRSDHPSLQRGHLFTGKPDEASGLHFANAPMKDVAWLDPNGHELKDHEMTSPGGFGILTSGDPGNTAPQQLGTTRNLLREGRDIPMLALVNPTMHDMEFTLPEVPGIKWSARINSEAPDQLDVAPDNKTKVGWHSVIIFEGERSVEKGTAADGHAAKAIRSQRKRARISPPSSLGNEGVSV